VGAEYPGRYEIRMRVAVVGTQSKVGKPREQLEFIY
jgi:hypothetical protein